MALVVLALFVLVFLYPLSIVRLKGGTDARPRRLPLVVRVLPAVLAVVLVVFSCLTTVGTKDVGVVTTFGRPTGRDLENGLHLKSPWQKVNELDGAINPDSYTGGVRASTVRIGDSTTACVEGTIRWRIVPTQASVLYQDYRSDDVNQTIRDSLVKTQFNAALNDVLGKYNPLGRPPRPRPRRDQKTGSQATVTTDRTQPRRVLRPRREVDGPAPGRGVDGAARATGRGPGEGHLGDAQLHPPRADTTQDKINDFLKEVGATRVAEQHQQTAQAQASANRQLARLGVQGPQRARQQVLRRAGGVDQGEVRPARRLQLLERREMPWWSRHGDHVGAPGVSCGTRARSWEARGRRGRRSGRWPTPRRRVGRAHDGSPRPAGWGRAGRCGRARGRSCATPPVGHLARAHQWVRRCRRCSPDRSGCGVLPRVLVADAEAVDRPGARARTTCSPSQGCRVEVAEHDGVHVT